jgi:hypothetical protein
VSVKFLPISCPPFNFIQTRKRSIRDMYDKSHPQNHQNPSSEQSPPFCFFPFPKTPKLQSMLLPPSFLTPRFGSTLDLVAAVYIINTTGFSQASTSPMTKFLFWYFIRRLLVRVSLASGFLGVFFGNWRSALGDLRMWMKERTEESEKQAFGSCKHVVRRRMSNDGDGIPNHRRLTSR